MAMRMSSTAQYVRRAEAHRDKPGVGYAWPGYDTEMAKPGNRPWRAEV